MWHNPENEWTQVYVTESRRRKQTTKLWIKMTKCPSGDRKQRGCMTRVLENLSTNRPSWWIGRSLGQVDELGGSAHDRTKMTQQPCCYVSIVMWKKAIAAQILRKQDKLNLKLSSDVLYPQFRQFPRNITSLVTLFPVRKTRAKCAFWIDFYSYILVMLFL